MMTNLEFIAALKLILGKFKTVYMWGVFGAPVTEALIVGKAKQYPKWYTLAKQAQLRGKAKKGYFGFDCVGLIKGVLWGWDGIEHSNYGGAQYASNNVPDIDANEMIKRCSGVSSDFKKIEPGEAVWMPGHIGVYIGDGKVIECTTAWEGNVQMSACLNIAPIKGLQGRKWEKHGKLPYVDYVSLPEVDQESKPAPKPTVKPNPNYRVHKVVKGDSLWHLALTYLGNGNRYKEIKDLNRLSSDMLKLNQILKIPPK